MISSRSFSNPYPGLRPFESDENYLFFGRDGQSNELLRRLRRNRFLSVVGISGSGKSSLVRAGLLPDLQSGMMAGRGSHWRIALFRPGADPIGNLSAALCQPGVLMSQSRPQEDGDHVMEAAFMTATLQRSAFGIVEAYRQAGLPRQANLLIVVDQYEELFRFKKNALTENAANQAAAFVKLLLAAVQEPEVPVYVIITMRSDFLGDCAQFPGLAEMINSGQYLVPRMSRGERREAIIGPAAVGGAEMTPRLVQRLLNDVGDDPDQLPILQHALMRTWAHWKRCRSEDRLVDLPDYEAIGTMANALSQHADEAYAELAEGQSDHGARERQRIAEKLFKFLTEKGRDNRETRRPGTLPDIAAAVNAAKHEVASVIDTFRKPGRCFLMPPADEELTNGVLIDISHESLIRNWQKLKDWVNEERRSIATYRRLAESAVLYRKGEAGLLRNPGLQVALDWREAQQPNQTWADLHYPAFDAAMDFLEESRRADEAEKAALENQAREKEEARQQQLIEERRRAAEQAGIARKFKLFTYALGLLFGMVILLGMFAGFQMLSSKSLRMAQKVKDLDSRAEIVFDKDPGFGLLLALEAVNSAYRPPHPLFRVLPNFVLKEASEALSKEKTESILILSNHLRNFHLKLTGHTQNVTTIAFHPDEKILASGGQDNKVILWDAVTGREIKVLKKHYKPLTSVVFSPGGDLLATSSEDGAAHLWDVSHLEQIKLLHRLEGHQGPVRHIEFDPEGKWLATAGEDKTVKIWDARGGNLLKDLTGHTAKVNMVRFNPSGNLLVSASQDGTARVWDVDSGATKHVLNGHSAGVLDVVFSPNETLIATVGDDLTFRVWRVQTGKEIHNYKKNVEDTLNLVAFSPDGKLVVAAGKDNKISGIRIAGDTSNPRFEDVDLGPGHTDQVNSVAFSPDSKYLATASKDGTARIWDIVSGKTVRSLDDHHDEVNAICFSAASSYLATAGRDKTARIWRWKARYKRKLIEATATSTYVFSPDGARMATYKQDKTITLWDLEKGIESDPFPGTTDRLSRLVYSPDGKQIAALGFVGSLKRWDTRTGKAMISIGEPKQRIINFRFSTDGKRITTWNSDGTITVWDSATGKEIFPIGDPARRVASAWFSADGNRIAVGSREGALTVWDTVSGKAMAALAEPVKRIASIIFSADGNKIVLGSHDGKVTVWDAATGKAVASLGDPAQWIVNTRFSSNDHIITTRSREGKVTVWDAATGKAMTSIGDPAQLTANVWFSSEGNRIATRSREGKVIVWDTATGKAMTAIGDPIQQIDSVKLSPDGSSIAIWSRDEKVTVWDTATGKAMIPIVGPIQRNADFSFSPDGRKIAVSNREGIIKVWAVEDPGRLMKPLTTLARQYVKRDFSPEECKQLPDTIEACEIFRRLDIANAMVQSDSIGMALSNFKEILATAPELSRTLQAMDLDPQLTVEKAASLLMATQLLKLAGGEIKKDNIENAGQLFRKAKAMVPEKWKGERQKLDQQYAQFLIEEVQQRMNVLRLRTRMKEKETGADDIKQTVELVDQAYLLSPFLTDYASLWNSLCWRGILKNEAEAVLGHCEKAVNEDPGYGSAQDSLAVARALLYDPKKDEVESIIKGFEAYIEFAEGKRPPSRINRRKRWIETLRTGGNPFDEDHRMQTLGELGNE